MSRYIVGDSVYQIYPAGAQPPQSVYNIGTEIVYLDDKSSVSDTTGFPLGPGSLIVWDGTKPLFAVCGSGKASALYVLTNQGPGVAGAVQVTNSVSLAGGVSVTNTTQNPVGVLQPQNGNDYWYWPTVSGEDFPPVFSGPTLPSYTRKAGINAVQLPFQIGGGARWGAPIAGPSAAYPIVVADFRVWTPTTSGGATLYIAWTNTPNNTPSLTDGLWMQFRSTSWGAMGSTVASYPAGVPAANAGFFNAQLRMDVANTHYRLLINGADVSGIRNTGTFNGSDYSFCAGSDGSTNYVGGPVRIAWEATL